jgi:endonuclease/exonuclease/phosphatase family metal-dependent hydrolase
MDGELSPQRIARIVADCRPDLVALQELDVGRRRSRAVDQATEIACELGMHLHFHPSFRAAEELFGDAILTAGPSELVKADILPGLSDRPHLEPRGAIWVKVESDQPLHLINTHLGLRRRERLAQVEALLGPGWLADPRCRGPVLLAGDFNVIPRSKAYRLLHSHLTDAHGAAGKTCATFPSYLPLFRIDYVFINDLVTVMSSHVVRSDLTRFASDHLPLVVDFEVVSFAS